jgi:hypothetical protein
MISLKIGGLILAAFIAGTFVASPELRAYAANTVFSSDIVDGEVKTPDIANSAVTNPKLAPNSVSYSKIATGSIDGTKIINGKIFKEDLASNSVDSSKVVDGSIASADLDPNIFDAMQAQIDALVAENAAQQAEIDDLTARVEALEANGGGTTTECNDGVDNASDSDTLIDLDDPGCADSSDSSELGTTQCDDGIDNDADGLTDTGDPGCSDASDTSEEDPIDATGTFSLEPVPSYSCGFGLVSFSPEQFIFSGTSTLTVNGDGLPSMTGDYFGDGVIDVSATLAGSCTETYSLAGNFVDADSWTGTFTAEYTGPDCNVPGDPCISQSWELTGQRVAQS